MEELVIDKEYISEMISTHGMVDTFAILESCFGSNMNYVINDRELRMIIWQIQHSISKLRKRINIMNFDSDYLTSVASSTKDFTALIILRHLIGSFDTLESYLTTE